MDTTIAYGDVMNTDITKRYRKYSYSTPLKKLILSQFGAAMLGIMTSMPTMTIADSGRTLGLLTSALAVAFLLYLQYTAMWELAAKDKIAIDGARLREDKLLGLKAAFFANLPTMGLAVIAIAFKGLHLLTDASWTNSVYTVAYAAVLMWNYMYHGVLSLIVPNSPASPIFLLYLASFIILTAPSMICSLVAYRMGLSGKRIFPEKKKSN